jgi:hypothetical protein
MRAEWGGGDERPVTRGERLMLGNQIIRASDLDVRHSVVPESRMWLPVLQRI